MIRSPKSNWRKMDSAPLDGTEVDLWAVRQRWTDCHYHCGEWLKWVSGSVDDEPHWRRIKDSIAWAEIPPPPKWDEARGAERET